jgi:hypothetical protein
VRAIAMRCAQVLEGFARPAGERTPYVEFASG